jgi:hypothetical protein
MRASGSVLVPVLSGALAAAAAGLLLGGWPGLPPITGPAPTVAAYALVAAPLLLILAAARRAAVVPDERLRTARRTAPMSHGRMHPAGALGVGPRPATSLAASTTGPRPLPVTWTFGTSPYRNAAAGPDLLPPTLLDDPYGPTRRRRSPDTGDRAPRLEFPPSIDRWRLDHEAV